MNQNEGDSSQNINDWNEASFFCLAVKLFKIQNYIRNY